LTDSLWLPSASATEKLGQSLARSAPWSGSDALIVFLEGELGSGKTTLARGLLHELGVTDTVRSPTYTLLETYTCGAYRVLHLDLYRLGTAQELEALGLRDELGGEVLVLIEWPERARTALPPPDLRVGLELADSGRRARLHPKLGRGVSWARAAVSLFQN
jgi:tRNA threonylcarbamoyladenosine biosynthesis protein TsaE